MATLTDTEAIEIGRTIRGVRRAQGLTQRQLAERAGVSRDAVLRIEKGHRSTRPSTIAAVTKALELDYHDLMPEREPHETVLSAPVGMEQEDEVDELMELARERAAREGVSWDEALGRMYRESALIQAHRPRKPRGTPRERRVKMSRPDAAAEAASAVRGE